jgi:glucose-1-phosphate cytidylyltransferase
MKCVIFCGGKGTRMGHMGEILPKPLLKVGDKPILIRIMNHYASYGVKDFILCLGFLGEKIRDYFSINPSEYNIKMVDTGKDSNKTERLFKVKNLLENEETFFVSYGDDICNVNIRKLEEFHKKQGKIGTLTAIKLPNPYGVLEFDDIEPQIVSGFKEKPLMNEWINGGYFIFEKRFLDFIENGEELEKGIFEELSLNKEMVAFRHKGFWKSMNTMKDYIELNEMFEKKELDKIFKLGEN